MSRVSAVFPGTPDQVSEARRWLAAWLGEDHPATDTTVLLLSETFTNSCTHSRSREEGGTVEITAELSERSVHVRVVDAGGGPASLVALARPDDAEDGRGLWLLDLLAKEWDWQRLPDGRLGVTFNVAY
ncbi:ATP-binding protein [Actinocorallia populi]|uniref:ATP-binding protein n=1 Tax=Actinocorallia populi TaxID=2079200 RepID=UPI0013004088|nr:ATP-binding protein [Actinocorallia populi]